MQNSSVVVAQVPYKVGQCTPYYYSLQATSTLANFSANVYTIFSYATDNCTGNFTLVAKAPVDTRFNDAVNPNVCLSLTKGIAGSVPLEPPVWYLEIGYIAGGTVGVLGASAAVVVLFSWVSQRRARVVEA